jgi:hypothetical protein
MASTGSPPKLEDSMLPSFDDIRDTLTQIFQDDHAITSSISIDRFSCIPPFTFHVLYSILIRIHISSTLPVPVDLYAVQPLLMCSLLASHAIPSLLPAPFIWAFTFLSIVILPISARLHVYYIGPTIMVAASSVYGSTLPKANRILKLTSNSKSTQACRKIKEKYYG